MEHYRKHLQCLMAGSKIQVKMYIHLNKQFTFTSFKEYNPKIKSMTNNKQTNKPQTVVFVIACFLFLFVLMEYYIFRILTCILRHLSNCSDDLHIVTNNGVYDEISNTVSFKDDFYLPCETRDDHLQSSVPI